MVETCSSASYKFLFLRKNKISIFGGMSKFHLWAEFVKFWQFWANFAALALADSTSRNVTSEYQAIVSEVGSRGRFGHQASAQIGLWNQPLTL
jgi:hypothetical protein